MTDHPRIVCISNRLPVFCRQSEQHTEFQPSSGGLVTAIGPILRKSRGVWIGWPGSVPNSEEQVRLALAEFSAQSEFELFPVILDQNSVVGFYQGFSNQVIWPLFHDLQSRCNFEPAFWSTYLSVQELFCAEVLKHLNTSDLVWVHDYHLMGLGRTLRSSGITNKICFFLHSPFPGPDIFLKLPWRADVINSLLSYDVIGFQTKRDLNNFIDCLENLTGSRCIPRSTLFSVSSSGRETLMGVFPISIDFGEFEEIARSEDVVTHAQQIRADMNVEFLILSIDRLDYTKGIPYRIKAFRRLLEMDSSLKKRIALLQVVVPSRIEVPEYQNLRLEIEQLVSELNGALGEPGWVPVHHLFRSLTREEVIAMYRASDVALVTPLKDGMNLVAKEYCASRIDNDGSIVLSEFAGAADEFASFAYMVNPYDTDDVARSINSALTSSKSDSDFRMRGIRDVLKKSDVFSWASSFLNAAGWEWKSIETAPAPRSITIWSRLRRITNVFDI